MNVEKVDTVLDWIAAHPEQHDQGNWGEVEIDSAGAVCGTTMCMAGATVVLNGYKLDLNIDRDAYPDPDRKVRMVPTTRCLDADGNSFSIEDVATEILGLTRPERTVFFYGCGDLESLRLVRDSIVDGTFDDLFEDEEEDDDLPLTAVTP